jgi:hypothetical protein
VRALPDSAPPFAAGPLLRAQGYARRTYARAGVPIEVTVAARPVGADEYVQWVGQSRAYAQATLALPPSEANGFYTCSGAACDLHIQLRSGYHVELMGGGRATRADLDALVARLPLQALQK